MIARGDKSARDAFRAGLRLDTPIPLPPVSTEELDAIDILEVRDVAEAIARAESTPRLPPSQPGPDIFDALATPRPTPSPLANATARRGPTDDASGPALPATPELIALADDAYYHPGGRVRSLADVTLDGYRPEPTMLVRIRERRSRNSWLVVALLIPLTALAAGAILSMAGGREDRSTKGEPRAAATGTARAAATATVGARAATTATAAERRDAKPTEAASPARPGSADAKPASADVPSFDVKNLPAARRR